jgi:hypothetical protein
MSKMRALLVGATVAGAFAASSMVPAFAADPVNVPTPIGTASAGGTGPGDGHLYLDGAAGNPDPGDGYLTVTAAGVCGADNGSPTSHTAGSESCNDAIITGQLP